SVEMPPTLLLAGDEAGTLRIWDPRKNQPFETHRVHGLAITGIDLMNQRVVRGGFLTASLDGSIRHSAAREKAAFGTETTSRGFAEPVPASAQGAGFFALAGGSGSIAIIDITLDEPRFVFRAHPSRINAMLLLREQGLLVTGGADGTLRF